MITTHVTTEATATEEDEPDYLARFKAIRQLQESKGPEEDTKRYYESSITAVLAYLQSTIDCEDIRKYIEKIYLAGMTRYAGLKILGQITHCYMNIETMKA
jgi:hypothetical protein